MSEVKLITEIQLLRFVDNIRDLDNNRLPAFYLRFYDSLPDIEKIIEEVFEGEKSTAGGGMAEVYNRELDRLKGKLLERINL